MATTTTTGINISGIPKIKNAIEAYKKKILKAANDIGAKKAVIKNAIQGDNTYKNLVLRLDAIEAEIKELLSSLDKYTNYLDQQLKSAYQSHDKSNESFYQKG